MRVAPPDFRVAPAVGPARDLGLRIAGALGRTPLPGATPAQAAVGHGRRFAASRAQALGDAFGGAAAGRRRMSPSAIAWKRSTR